MTAFEISLASTNFPSLFIDVNYTEMLFYCQIDFVPFKQFLHIFFMNFRFMLLKASGFRYNGMRFAIFQEK